VGPVHQEFSNVWETFDDNKRKTNGLLEKLFTIEKQMQTSTTAAESSAFVAHAATTKSQSVAIKTTSSKPSGSNAEDTNILFIGTDEETLQAKLSSVMKQLEVWFPKNDLIINTAERVAMSFTVFPGP
jgi:hypothetical protein